MILFRRKNRNKNNVISAKGYCKKTNGGEAHMYIVYTSICPSLVFIRASAENSWKSPLRGAAGEYIYRLAKVESSLRFLISSHAGLNLNLGTY